MPPFYVKKIYSLNPTKYKYITFRQAEKDYYFYVQCFIGAVQKGTKLNLKTFTQWLRTEI